MCSPEPVSVARLRALSAEDREPLAAFAASRFLGASDDGARDFWAEVWAAAALDGEAYLLLRKQVDEAGQAAHAAATEAAQEHAEVATLAARRAARYARVAASLATTTIQPET